MYVQFFFRGNSARITSVEGVPGYPLPTSTPDSMIPSAIASFPINNFFKFIPFLHQNFSTSFKTWINLSISKLK